MVQLANTSPIVVWIIASISVSIAAVASSNTRIYARIVLLFTSQYRIKLNEYNNRKIDFQFIANAFEHGAAVEMPHYCRVVIRV